MSDLSNTAWALDGVRRAGKVTPIRPVGAYTYVFGTREVHGAASCNGFDASFVASGDVFTLLDEVGTAAFCLRDPLAHVVLGTATGRFVRGDKQLEVFHENGSLLYRPLTIQPVPPRSPTGGLENTSWSRGTAVLRFLPSGANPGNALYIDGAVTSLGTYVTNGDTVHFDWSRCSTPCAARGLCSARSAPSPPGPLRLRYGDADLNLDAILQTQPATRHNEHTPSVD